MMIMLLYHPFRVSLPVGNITVNLCVHGGGGGGGRWRNEREEI